MSLTANPAAQKSMPYGYEVIGKFVGRAKYPSGAKAHDHFALFTYGLKPVPFKTDSN
jgi:hypothetical protein